MTYCDRHPDRPARFTAQIRVNGRVRRLTLCEECMLQLQQGAAAAGGGPGSGAASQEGKASTTTVRDRVANVPFITDLTGQAENDRLDPVIGRETETERMLEILLRKKKRNPVLIGPAGVGKTAVVEGLAQRIVRGEIPEQLRDARIYSLDMGQLLAGTQHRGEFEQRLKTLIEQLSNTEQAILFIDELHTVLGAGNAEGGTDAANLLKPALARDQIRCIGATTVDEYRRYVEEDRALSRRFQPVTIEEPPVEQTLAILNGLQKVYEEHHRVHFEPAALKAAARLADRYIHDRYLPDKAIDLIDETAARINAQQDETSERAQLQQQLKQMEQQLKDAAESEHFERAAELKQQRDRLEAKLRQSPDADDGHERPRVTAADIAQTVTDWTGIPVNLQKDEAGELLQLEQTLQQRVMGQDEALASVSKAIRRNRAGLKDPKRPIGSFLFAGPTGVGKTETAKALAETLFGDEEALISIDMSEYMEGHNSSRLTGAPPGYVGYDDAGQLTEHVRRRPYSVVLFDEFEKAHPELQNTLLQILEEGRLTDGQGRTTDFTQTVVILTSNLGTEELAQGKSIGFGRDQRAGSAGQVSEAQQQVEERIHQTLKPEFINRLDDIIVFRSLDKDSLHQIVDKMLDELNERLADQEVFLEVSEQARDWLVERGYKPEYGARELRRVIRREVEDPLSERLLAGDRSGRIYVDCREDKKQLTFS